MIKYIFEIMSYIKHKLFPSKDSNAVYWNTKKDKPDKRDFTITSISKTPSKYSINSLPPVRNQGIFNSCCSHAVIGAYEIMLSKTRYIEGSERFHYYNVRKEYYKTLDNVGMTIRDGVKGLKQFGFAFEQTCPYSASKVNKKPSDIAYMFSKLYKIRYYRRVNNIESIKSLISRDIPIICGIYVTMPLMNTKRNDDIYVPKGKRMGGHAVILTGYDDTKGTFTIRNSWGKNWGNYGYFKMKYEDFKKYSFDWWVIKLKGGE